MNPPLRTKKDVEALNRGLKDGTIKVISTDHAPHSAGKNRFYEECSFWHCGNLETSFALSYTALVERGNSHTYTAC